MIRRTAAALAASACFLLAHHSRAAEPTANERADAFFEIGTTAFARREFAAAGRAFESAHQELPRAAAAFNAAVAWDAAGDHSRAANNYALALEGIDLSPEQARVAEPRLAELRALLALLDFTRDDQTRIRVDGVDVERRSVHVPPGEHEIALRRGDATERTLRVTVAAGERRSFVFDPPRPPQNDQRAATAPPPPREVTSPTRGNLPRTRHSSSLRGWAYVAWGGAVVSGAVGAVLGVRALDARDEFDASGRTDAEARDRTLSLRAWSSVGIVSSVLLATTGVVLFTTSSGEPSPRAALRLGPGVVSITGSF